jgi:hypothetical protein
MLCLRNHLIYKPDLVCLSHIDELPGEHDFKGPAQAPVVAHSAASRRIQG